MLGTSTLSLDSIFPRLHSMVEIQLVEIKAQLERGRTRMYLKAVNHKIMRRLLGKVTEQALVLLHDEIVSIQDKDPNRCVCSIQSYCGLPCSHDLSAILASDGYISLASIHPFWKILDLEGDSATVITENEHWVSIKESLNELSGLHPSKWRWYADQIHNMIHPDDTHVT